MAYSATPSTDLERVAQVPQGSLYPALHRLENRGLLTADWNMSDTGRESKFYRLTPQRTKAAESRGCQLVAAGRGERADF
jgi:DNA-binding PadR family transcriptional regulator